MNIYYLIATILELALGIPLTINYCHSKQHTLWDKFALGQNYVFIILFAILTFIR